MIGAIAADIIGSTYEFASIKTKDFPLFDDRSFFTDDSVLTVAVADMILHGGSYGQLFRDYSRRYPGRSYGLRFHRWAESENPAPYQSFGNGSVCA